jgi:hypothetical protein
MSALGSRLFSRVVPERSPGIVKDRPSSVPTTDTPENEVIRESRASVRSPTEMSVSAIEIADCRTVSGRLCRLSEGVAELRRLDDGGVSDERLVTDEGRSFGGGGLLRRKTEVLRVRTLDGLDVLEWSASGSRINERLRLNAENTLKAVGGWLGGGGE